MKNLGSRFLCLILLCSVCDAFSQGEIPVDMYTGTPHIEVAIAHLQSHDLSESVSLSYNAKGIRPAEGNGGFGLSWQIRAGGTVYREVRGLPDDYLGDTQDTRRGWLYQRPSVTPYLCEEIAAFTNSADLSASTCTDEINDYSAILEYAYSYDTQPDIFHFSVGEVSGSFVFDNTATPTIRLIPFQDIKIEPLFVSNSRRINGFKLTTNTGVVHTFGPGRTETRYTEKLPLEDTVEFNKTEYQLYSYLNHSTSVWYYAEWELDKTKSPSGDSISYTYQFTSIPGPSTSDVSAIISNPSATTYSTHAIYTDHMTTNAREIKTIQTACGSELEFVSEDGLITSILLKDGRAGTDTIPHTIKVFNISYLTSNGRSLIKSITETGGDESLPPYQFDYYYSFIPTFTGRGIDFWGYYNGTFNDHLAPAIHVYPDLPPSERFRLEEISGYSGTHYVIPGANRKVNPSFIQAGTLKSITYPMGGTATLTYESNTYYDSVADQEYYGGGLRIKSMTYMNGLNPDAKIQKYFYYTDDSGKTSGRLISKPAFSMLTWKYKDPTSNYENALLDDEGGWSYLVVRSEHSISDDALTGRSPVGYKQVTVQRRGNGYATYQYHVPAAYGSDTANNWVATVNKFARGSGCPDLKHQASGAGINAFPYASNPNFDFERGLVKEKREFSEDSILVRETKYTYQYLYKSGTEPEKVWGLRYEKYPNSDDDIFLYGKYYFLTDVVKVPASEVVSTYDTQDSLKKVTATTEYFYESPSHKLLSRIKNTSIDGTVQQTYIKYPLDYGVVPSGADEPSEMIGLLQTQFRNGTPIERYQTIQLVGENEKVVGGSVVKFSDFGVAGKILPQYQMTWRSYEPELISGFTSSHIDATS